MPIAFDPAARRIILDTTSVSASEVWSRWADWVAAGDNAKYLPALRHVGGDDLGGGRLIPHYLFLLNGWRVRPMESDHTLVIDGNLFVEGGGSPVVSTLGAHQVLAQLTVPVQAQGYSTTGGGGPSAASVADAVWQRVLEAGLTAEQMQRVMLAALTGQSAGMGTSTETYLARDGATPRVTAVFDTAGNRAGVTVNGA